MNVRNQKALEARLSMGSDIEDNILSNKFKQLNFTRSSNFKQINLSRSSNFKQ